MDLLTFCALCVAAWLVDRTINSSGREKYMTGYRDGLRHSLEILSDVKNEKDAA